MNGDAKQTRTKAIKSRCRRGARTSFKSFLTLIAEILTAQILIIYAPGQLYMHRWFRSMGAISTP